ncbi:MAG: hypothetical protein RJA69_456 [Pseudomonadota bacterium]|jgi:hypothetical protein
MKKSVALATLTATCVWVASLHVDWTAHDNGHLLVIDGAPVDLLGEVSERWNKATRQCTQVRRVSADEHIHAQALSVIMAYSPPQSRLARLVSLWARDDWLLAEVEFEELFPAVVLIDRSTPHLSIVPQAVWSGVTKPWKAAPHIRHYLSGHVTGVPVDLFRCFDPQSDAF